MRRAAANFLRPKHYPEIIWIDELNFTAFLNVTPKASACATKRFTALFVPGLGEIERIRNRLIKAGD